MSFREEESQKNCPSRGLGLAAAAIGVGVGAALYYFFSKRPENPTTSGSTTEEWHCEPEHTFPEEYDSDSSYSTISEYTTTDTSIVEDSGESLIYLNCTSEEESDMSASDLSESSTETDISSEDSVSSSSLSADAIDAADELFSTLENAMDIEVANGIANFMEWDITSTTDVPSVIPAHRHPINALLSRLFSPKCLTSRERTKTNEHCSICFEMMAPDQECMALPCSHLFHNTCILPWLQEQQTCPNCRERIY